MEAETANQETPSATNEHAQFSLPAGELARITRMLTGKGSAGPPPFMAMGYELNLPGQVTVRHVDALKARTIYATFDAQVAIPGAIATNDTPRFMDYITSPMFNSELPLTLEASNGKINITNAGRSITMGAVDNDKLVPRSMVRDGYGQVANGVMVSSSPQRRPKDGSAWEDWAAAGFVVFHTTPTELQSLLAAGAIAAKRYKNALFRFTVTDTVTVSIQEARDHTADVIDYGTVGGKLLSNVGASFSLGYAMCEPLWSAAASAKVKEVTLVHHTDNASVNFCYAEMNTPTNLRMSQKIHSFERAKQPLA